MNKLVLTGVALALASGLAQGEDKFFVSAYLGTPLNDLDVSGDYAGASGYVSPTSPTGKMGGLSTDEKTSFGFALGYKIDANFRVGFSYANFNYGTTRWGSDFISFNGTYNPATATQLVGKLSSDAYFMGASYEQSFAKDWNWEVGAAVGLARNKFHSADEGGYAQVPSNTQTEFAYWLTAGLGYKLTEQMKVTANVGVVDIGDFESAKIRLMGGVTPESIAPYKFETKLQPVATLGLSYSF